MERENPMEDFREFVNKFNLTRNLSKEELLNQAVVKEVGHNYGLTEKGMTEAISSLYS